ncbi:transcriptional regulator [Aurantimonas sp. 22II-16-19i]|uniref:transcriptional regulator n=1 Tax=Aurantimonas sp. 22II-16-19i TaxID=1317114 RepID=UPI0009F7FD08|nr:transcriptional regulator [Aurantimonas sp. 22II-16-19i]MAU96188.1 transcriptional regulator [Fulvimarina sp.]ORE98679.1 transcriptional regulator [Aurantimonas sp. 22II-16-19i]
MNQRQSFEEKTLLAWGDDRPDWIVELARFADAEGLTGAGKRVGRPASTLSQTLSNTYRGDVGKIEERVRGALMALTVECPVLGEIGRDRCLDEQGKDFSGTSAMRAQLYRACRFSGCPHSKHTKGTDHG